MTARKLSTVDVKAVHVSEEKPRRVLRTEKHTVLVAPYADGSTAALLRELGPAEEAVGERLGGAELGLRRLEP